MARERHVMILALVMLAMIGFAYAAEAPMPSEDDYEEEEDDEFLIGTRRGDPPLPGGIVAAPLGGPVPPGAFDTTPPSADASSIHLSAVAGTAATAAIAGFFYF
ncbi:hypothetical protein L195_g000477 [Trifolium pratense]|uniref:Uncharacterized protein n=2 Tax=Trifolium pratense TaxID=57577 RepID=A0ACB0M627_TRIPR|nr:hypothetical protein L195_g000477 [Trifolium pratense]CAJ2677160.1 unnamed protein product [Trifolium pratense]